MSPVRIVTDSTADIPRDLVNKYNITVVPLKVIFENETLLDGFEISSQEFFKRQVENKEMSRTSQPAPADFFTVYSDLSAGGDSVISIHISSVMSGTCQSANMAREILPSADIEVIDSRFTSMGLGLIVLEAASAAYEGKSKEYIMDLIREMIDRVQLFFIVNTLEYLARGGRIGRAQAFLGTILNIMPLLYMKDGTVNPYEKVRGKSKAIERLSQVVVEKSGGKKIKCSIVHGVNPSGAEQFMKRLADSIDCGEPIIAEIGSVVGTHTGPGVIGIAFIAL